MRALLGLSLCCALVTACGGASPAGHSPTGRSTPGRSTTAPATVHRERDVAARRVCAAARRAVAVQTKRVVAVRVTSGDPVDLTCRLTAGRIRINVEAQASAQAWAEWDTVQVHQIQAYGSGGVHQPAEIPRIIATHDDTLAGWIPAERELFATNASETTAGSYVTAIGSPGSSARVLRRLTFGVALAALAVAPKGPTP